MYIQKRRMMNKGVDRDPNLTPPILDRVTMDERTAR
jgi:hypothetical protein